MEEFLRSVVFREDNRCRYCYYSRLENTVLIAKREKMEGFTTTLLYSKFQDHEMIKDIGESLSKKHGIEFFYQDFRKGWKRELEYPRNWVCTDNSIVDVSTVKKKDSVISKNLNIF